MDHTTGLRRVDIADMAPKKRDRCIKEVHLLQQLNHPHIITMYDAFIDQNQLTIVTEWAPGGEGTATTLAELCACSIWVFATGSRQLLLERPQTQSTSTADAHLMRCSLSIRSAGDLKKLIRRMADAGKRFEEPEIWQYFLQVLLGSLCHWQLMQLAAAACCHCKDTGPASSWQMPWQC
eukprot:GHUV01053603.1.p1 GENE.GHUV01053603.1~~GHUV01053603.1.p1  ORF type:complete len:179 (+),score=36.13 GHUV01053603.1:770-1306(+)